MNSDLISREALKNTILLGNYDTQSKILSAIDKAPTVKERPQGEWIEHYSKEMSEKGYFLCSRCKCGFQRFERGIRQSDLPWIDGQKYELHCIDNFCPNCGADMRGGDKK